MAKSAAIFCSYCGQRIYMSAKRTPPNGIWHHTDLEGNPSYDAHMGCRLAITETQRWGKDPPCNPPSAT